MNEPIVLGGRAFRRDEEKPTLGQIVHFDHLVAGAGLRDLLQGPGESAAAFATRILYELERDGKVFEMLGIFLIPVELGENDWTPQIARATAAHLKAIRGMNAEEWAAVKALVVTLVMGLFASGQASAKRIESSSKGISVEPSPALLTNGMAHGAN